MVSLSDVIQTGRPRGPKRPSAPKVRFPSAAALVILILAAPVLAGVAGTLLPAVGVFPALGYTEVSLDPIKALLAWPGLAASFSLSVRTGFIATVTSLALTMLIVATLHRTRIFKLLISQLSVLLSIPHAAAAFGLVFLMLPSGWIARALSPGLTGWDRAPDLLLVQDPFGLSLILGLVLKEVPFLLLVTLSAMGQVQSQQSLRSAAAMGYRPVTAWTKVVFPQVYRQIRLPIFAVLAFSLSVVDMAVILGPNTPPPLAVQVVQWMNDPDLNLRLQAAAGASLQLILVLAALLFWRLGELAVGRFGQLWTQAGGRGRLFAEKLAQSAGTLTAVTLSATMFLGIFGLAVWSVAGLWTFPDALPEQFTWRTWERQGPMLWPTVIDTAVIALAASAIGLALTIACLETETRLQLRPGRGSLLLLYLPLMVPQIAFLGGLQTFTLSLGLQGNVPTVIAAHLIFVLPYVFLTLAQPWRAWDRRYATVGLTLGASQSRVLWRIRLPMLLRPVLTAAAVGVSVSVGQYLATLLISGGRVETLTTEAVALASGGNRRVIGVTAVAQTLLALAPFAAALLLPRLLMKNGRA